MQIYTTETMSFYGKYRQDGLHLIHEIDDDETGFKSGIRYIVPPEAVTKLFSLISREGFIEICRKEGLSGMEEFFGSNEIPYRREGLW